MISKKGMATAVFATLLCTGLAHASSFNNTAGLTGLVPSFTTETFDGVSVPNDTLAGNLFAGVTFDGNTHVTNQYSGSFANFVGNALTNFFPCCAAQTMFTFANPVSAVGFSLATNPGVTTFTAELGGNVVETFSAPTSTSGSVNFYGFTGITFDSIQINAGGSNNAYAMDNLQVAAVPESETYAMLLAGLGLLGFMTRRKAS